MATEGITITNTGRRASPVSKPLVRKEVQVILSYGTGPRGDGPAEEVKLTGHRVSATVNIAGGVGLGQATVRIWGMTLDLMNKCSTIGNLPTVVRRNSIVIAAGDKESGVHKIFEGTLTSAWADFGAAPEVVFQIVAMAGAIESVTQTPPLSRKGPVQAESILAELAAKAGLNFDNSARARRTLPSTTLKGSLGNQISTCAAAARFHKLIHLGTLIIWPFEGYRPTPQVPLISADTGMVGYPSFTAVGVMVQSLFRPEIEFGGLVEVKARFREREDNLLRQANLTAKTPSSRFPINGQWQVYSLVHDVDAELPGGKWFTQMMLTEKGNIVVFSST